MTRSARYKLAFRRTLLFSAVGLLCLAAPFVFARVSSKPVQAQPLSQATSSSDLFFEVASIKLNRDAHRFSIGFHPDRFTTIGTTVRSLVKYAYGLQSDSQVLGGPSWIGSEKYDINAVIEDSEAKKLQQISEEEQAEQVKSMVRSLLAERFRLTVSHTKKEVPVYVLVLSKNGPRLSPGRVLGQKDKGAPGIHGSRGDLSGTDATIGLLIRVLSGQPELEDRVILDQTGLNRTYDFSLQWAPEHLGQLSNDPSTTQADAVSSDSSSPSLFTAIQEQLGLRLRATKGPVDAIKIQHVERPSGN